VIDEQGYLTASEIEADPSVLRNPSGKQKQRNRSGQVAGASKLHIHGQFSPRLIEMLESFAYRVLSLSARRIMDRLEIELAKHGGKPEANGELVCTYADFEAYGVANRHQIAPAIRELVALGFIRITRRGAAGNSDHRQAAMYLLTYRHAGSNRVVEDGWRRILSLDEAERLAQAARARKADARAREFGQRGGRAAAAAAIARKKILGVENDTDAGVENDTDPVSKTALKGSKFPVPKMTPLSRVSLGSGCEPAIDALRPEPPAKPPVLSDINEPHERSECVPKRSAGLPARSDLHPQPRLVRTGPVVTNGRHDAWLEEAYGGKAALAAARAASGPVSPSTVACRWVLADATSSHFTECPHQRLNSGQASAREPRTARRAVLPNGASHDG
jgi:hypothetical protein